METQWADWIAVGLAVAGAAAWLAWRARRQWKRRQASGGSPTCGGCDTCPFGKDCSGENQG